MNTDVFSNGHKDIKGRNKSQILTGFWIKSSECVCAANFASVRKCSIQKLPAPGRIFLTQWGLFTRALTFSRKFWKLLLIESFVKIPFSAKAKTSFVWKLYWKQTRCCSLDSPSAPASTASPANLLYCLRLFLPLTLTFLVSQTFVVSSYGYWWRTNRFHK